MFGPERDGSIRADRTAPGARELWRTGAGRPPFRLDATTRSRGLFVRIRGRAERRSATGEETDSLDRTRREPTASPADDSECWFGRARATFGLGTLLVAVVLFLSRSRHLDDRDRLHRRTSCSGFRAERSRAYPAPNSLENRSPRSPADLDYVPDGRFRRVRRRRCSSTRPSAGSGKLALTGDPVGRPRNCRCGFLQTATHRLGGMTVPAPARTTIDDRSNDSYVRSRVPSRRSGEIADWRVVERGAGEGARRSAR